jgi:hypothetical protein
MRPQARWVAEPQLASMIASKERLACERGHIGCSSFEISVRPARRVTTLTDPRDAKRYIHPRRASVLGPQTWQTYAPKVHMLPRRWLTIGLALLTIAVCAASLLAPAFSKRELVRVIFVHPGE